MPALVAIDLGFAHSDDAPLFASVHFHLAHGFCGLVGENGAGKTTLLRLLAGELAPSSGSVRVEPPGARVVLCRQDVEARDEAIDALADAQDGLARRVRGELGLAPEDLARWPTLSPGERKRWQIGAALAAEPDVLLLDEPTNHLDADGRARLVATLARHRGIGVIVSHDRALLDALTTRTLRLHRGGAELTPGAYGEARAQWDRARRFEEDERDRRQAELRAAERRLADARRAHEGAKRATSSGRRMKDPRDRDGASMANKMRAESGEARAGRVVAVRRAEAERAAERARVDVVKEHGGRVFVDWEPAPRPRLATLSTASLRAGDHEVLRDVSASLARDARVHLRGANGAGKTTLLRALVAEARLPAERVLFVPQQIDARDALARLDEVRALPPTARGRVLSILAALGADPGRVLASRAPSPGEARKLALAFGLGRYVWALVLDEPTNHLDLPTIERLEGALDGYPGALVLVSHDEPFARRCTREVWTIEAGRLRTS